MPEVILESLSLKIDGGRAGPLAVRALVHRPDAPEPPFFLLTHGAGGDLNTAGLVALAEGLSHSRHLVVRVDLPYRAAGRATPPLAEKSVPGFVETFQKLRTLLDPEASWVVGGRSYGGRVASMAVAAGLPVAGLLLYSYPLHRPGNPAQLRVAHFPSIKVPTLFLEGTHDPFCDLDLLKAQLPALGAPATLHVVEGADHSLKVARLNSPDGKARSEMHVATRLAPVVLEWAQAP
ncbi:MAG: alpha/beta hydrolase family protein [Actinomycetota bacterium]